MIGNPKPLASLSSGLLARKGQARPAMRPQGFGGFGATQQNLEDLGWNDMGDAPSELAFPESASVMGIIDPQGAGHAHATAPAASIPPVLHQRAALAYEVEALSPAPPEPNIAAVTPAQPAPVAATSPAKPRQPVAARLMAGAKAAFTLRLDAERHLRLRLASALQNRSSQQLVTQALDALLATLPDVEEMARRQGAGGTHDLNKGI